MEVYKKFHVSENCLGEPLNRELTVFDQTRTTPHNKEYRCKCVDTQFNPNTKRVEKITHYYWLGEDYLQNNINRKRMKEVLK